MPKSCEIWISDEANKIIVEELLVINKGCTNRRGDFILTKAELCSRIIDEHYGIKVDEKLDKKK